MSQCNQQCSNGPCYKKQNNLVETGRKAYRMNVLVTGNPHSKPPSSDLWDKGWRLERRKEEATSMPRSAKRPPFKRESASTGAAQGYRPKHQSRRPEHSAAFVVAPQTPQQEQPVITDKLISRFNRRHQTRL